MLPPSLKKILERLEAQPETRLSAEERELLEELRFVNRNLSEEQAMKEEKGAWLTRVVSGPGGACPCCGQ